MTHETFDGAKDSILLKMDENERRQMDAAELRCGEEAYALAMEIAEAIAERESIDLSQLDWWHCDRPDADHFLAYSFYRG